MEVLLLVAVVGIPLLVGAILVGRKLYTVYLNQTAFETLPLSRAEAWDSTGQAIGPVLGYDPYEAPLVLFRDSTTSAGIVLGVRSDRFTSYGEVFYTNAACSATQESTPGYPKIRAASADVATTLGNANLYPPVGFLYQLFGRSYAVGSGNTLYTTADGVTPENVSAGPPGPALYVWKSQNLSPPTGVAPEPPCFPVTAGDTIEDLVTARVVIDLDTVYAPPYRLAFPTPGEAPPQPCPTGECP